MIQPILLLGDPLLYQVSQPVLPEESALLPQLEADLHDTLMEYRRLHRAGRAIAAPQIGIQKRVLYLHINEPLLVVNPTLTFPDAEIIQVWDDCMCFPNLLVHVERLKNCLLTFQDRDLQPRQLTLSGSLSELIQHEFDHLEGILATMRALDKHSFRLIRIK
jgi:peptide deformylase